MTLKDITKITQRMNVLFVEDDELVKDVTSRILHTFFPNLDLASNGLEGIEKFKEKDYHLIITDLEMPKFHGVDMIKEMKTINPDIYVIVLSAMNNTNLVMETIKIGIDGYLFKPLMFEKFLEILEVIVKQESVNQKISSYSKNLEDIVKERTKDLENKINTDELTSFGTLPSLMSKLDTIDNFYSPIVILINIDGFGMFNQLYGLKKGNEILIEFSKLLTNYNEDRGYTLFRINADEFVLLDSVEYLDIDKYEKDLNDLFKTIETTTLKIDGIEEPIEIEITAGISFSSSQTLKKANMALYEARKRGRNFIGFTYDIDYTNEVQTNLFWRQEIKHAIVENRIVAFYQPIVDRDQNIVQYESLIRLKKQNADGTVEYLVPDKFLDLSMMTKQYIQLTKFMIETTLRNMQEKNVAISINLTYQDIKNDDIYSILKTNIQKYSLENQTEFDISNDVIFEILEHEGVDCFNTFVDFVKEFKDMGVKIALDDFGTGFSNFSHITSLSPDYIKIDGALIENINEDKKAYELVKAIVKFASELNIKTIAEHVHSKEVYETVYDLGINRFQGYYFGVPSEKI
jgi:predicted signal transduction protein with EAL and GGDEF domain